MRNVRKKRINEGRLCNINLLHLRICTKEMSKEVVWVVQEAWVVLEVQEATEGAEEDIMEIIMEWMVDTVVEDIWVEEVGTEILVAAEEGLTTRGISGIMVIEWIVIMIITEVQVEWIEVPVRIISMDVVTEITAISITG